MTSFSQPTTASAASNPVLARTPRPFLLLQPQREPIAPRPAATILLLRDQVDNQGFEVLMTRRSEHARFASNAYVFPGGGIEEQDQLAAHHALATMSTGQAAQSWLVSQALAGIRETFEELGILLAYDEQGQPVTGQEVAQLSRHESIYVQCQTRGWTLAVDQMQYLAHWTADRNLQKRFSTAFFIARMPQGQTPVADETEQFEPTWLTPQRAVQRYEEQALNMLFPTIRTLRKLTHYANTQAVFKASQHQQPLWDSTPRTGMQQDKELRTMEGDMPFGELAMVSPDGQLSHPLHWQFEPVTLRKNLLRVTAPNPGVMTGPGTNSYLVGDADTGYIAIDPGPKDPAHLQRMLEAAGGDIRHIVCTHSHPDHSPGAAPLQALVEQTGRPRPAIYGLPSGPTANLQSRFKPEQKLQDGQHITVSGSGPQGPISHTLQAVHTPGHAANHVCLLLVEDALLFSGDHILNGSTTIINPPDGNMRDYMDSLDKLDDLCEQHAVEFILPAHGYVLGSARQTIALLKKHRLTREAKVLAAMRTKPDGSIRDWVELAYADTPPALWPIAERSLLAHVERIQMLCLGR